MVQPFRPAEVHGERCCERAATGLDVLPQIPHVLPHIDQLMQPQQQAATHYLVPAGARIGFGAGWGLVRASNTGPILVMRFEAASEGELAKIRTELESAVKEERSRLESAATS